MKTQNIRRLFSIVLLTVAFVTLQSARVSEMQIAIQVSPNVLNLNNQGEVVTIHTDIAYGLVVGASVTLNGLPIDWWKSDDRGNFVAKFYMEAVKGMPLNLNDYNTLTLTGTTIYGDTFTGSDEIKVVKIVPKK
jgi:hypothetical protein